jgi:hypothetical protein
MQLAQEYAARGWLEGTDHAGPGRLQWRSKAHAQDRPGTYQTDYAFVAIDVPKKMTILPILPGLHGGVRHVCTVPKLSVRFLYTT